MELYPCWEKGIDLLVWGENRGWLQTWYQSNDMGKPVRQSFPLVSARELLHCIPQYLCLCDRTEVSCKRGISGNLTFV